MELGKRIRDARQAAGLSQRQLCGEQITRNMLSRIENGAVRPSVTTLRFLAEQLGKPVSYFLDEDALTSPNAELMRQAREVFPEDPAGALKLLEDFQQPDGTFDWERWLLEAKCCLALAGQALDRGQAPYGAELLARAARAGARTPYYGPELERERLLLLARTGAAVTLPADDRVLLLRARQALKREDHAGCLTCLEAAQDRQGAEWNYLRGEALFAQGAFAAAAGCYRRAEESYPKQVFPRLEACYRALEDYKMAYQYALKQREKTER